MSDTNVLSVDLSKAANIGENIKACNVDGKLVLVIDTTAEIGLSSTGKMMGIANTGGFTQLGSGLKLNLYLGKKPR